MIIPSLDGTFEDILDFTSESFSDSFPEDILDSRLDADSVLIEDIKLENDHDFFYQDQSTDTVILQTHIKEELKDEEEESMSPHPRDRCNTWPRLLMESPDSWTAAAQPAQQCPEPGPSLACVSEESSADVDNGLDCENSYHDAHLDHESNSGTGVTMYGRRNPWGNHSYADLITQAISSSPDKKLTLSQIYDWMVANIPYFSERQSNSKSAGWKNSIRHNLSLHQKFVKVPNEGAGKSSWWTLNLDGCQPRKPRRRATSGDIKMLSSKRERVRTRTESAKHPDRLTRSYSSSGMLPQPQPIPNQSSSLYPDPVSRSFTTFRTRNISTTSTASLESSGFNMEDLVTSELTSNSFREEPNLDLANFSINNYDLTSLSTEAQPQTDLNQSAIVKQKLMILEPRDCPFPQGPPTQNQSEAYNDDIAALKMMDEERRQMIVHQLELLNHKKMTEGADVDQSILLLQDQLNSMVRRQQDASIM